MILQALDGYYRRLESRGESVVPSYGYSDQPVSYALVLSAEGLLVDVLPLGTTGRRGIDPTRMPVPAPVIRTSGVAANFLWDKTAYVLGVKRDPTDRDGTIETPREHQAFRTLHQELLTSTEDVALRALIRFLESWSPARFAGSPLNNDVLDTNLVFRLDGERRFVHERPAARAIWADQLARRSGGDAFCLVTGRTAPIARLHSSIKGVRNAQSSGAAIVSFNLDAFTSFGKEQGANAPVCEEAAFAYTTALNHLLRPGEQNRQKLQIADATTVFWAEAARPEEDESAQAAEDLFASLMSPPSEETLDAGETARLHDRLEAIAEGRPLKDVDPKLDAHTRMFVLGLSPNASRLSVRFWCVDTLEALARRYAQNRQDLEIEPRPWKTPPAVWRLLLETAAQRKSENIPPAFAGDVLRAVLTGALYPRTFLTSVVMRCRADRDLNGMRAAILKACLVRADRKLEARESVSVSLDRSEANAGYRLGRLFAVLESIQRTALGKVNATIRDRYYGAASATPGSVFPILLRNVGHHLSNVRKGENAGLAGWFEREIGEIVQGLGTTLPRNLPISDQGRFAIGYYHQRYSPRSDAPASVGAGSDPENDHDTNDEA